MQPRSNTRTIRTLTQATIVLGIALSALSAGAQQRGDHEGAAYFWPGNLVVSRSVYDNNPANVKVGTVLPPNCASTQGGCSASTGAIANGAYPYVFNNDIYDASFGITSRIFLDQLSPEGWYIDSARSPQQLSTAASTARAISSLPASAPSQRSPSISPPIIAFSPSWATSLRSTPSTFRTPTRPSPSIRRIPLDSSSIVPSQRWTAAGISRFTETNAYSGNNGRAAILNNTDGEPFFYTAGNAGNGANPQPNGVDPRRRCAAHRPIHQRRSQQDPGAPTPVASF